MTEDQDKMLNSHETRLSLIEQSHSDIKGIYKIINGNGDIKEGMAYKLDRAIDILTKLVDEHQSMKQRCEAVNSGELDKKKDEISMYRFAKWMVTNKTGQVLTIVLLVAVLGPETVSGVMKIIKELFFLTPQM